MAEDVGLAEKCINTIRVVSAETVQAGKSGHPGAPMGCAPMAHLLWSEVMKFSGAHPKWPGRDRFVLSNGHGCALQYTMLHLAGYNVTLDDLGKFRHVGSKTPGHPEVGITDGVEVSTGPLGQGISNAVGLAVAEEHLRARFSKPDFPVIDNFTYVICGDGCLQEGVSSEACSLAGTMKLGKLIVLYDDNLITIDGETELSFTEDVGARYEAYGWHVQTVGDGNTSDLSALRAAVAEAQAVTDKPSIIKIRTLIGYGAKLEGSHKVHGAPIGDEDIATVKAKWGMDPAAKFAIAPEVSELYATVQEKAKAAHAAWTEMFGKYEAAHPALAAEFKRVFDKELPAGCFDVLPTASPADKAIATRKASQAVLTALVPAIPELVGGSADLTPSNLTKVDGNAVDFAPATREGRYIRFGVREHGMCAVSNGIAAYGGIIPFAATFVVFTGYCIGSIRVSALSHLQVLYIFTHDSIGLGEDGPTHQPIETLAHVRALPNILCIRPCDVNETSGAYKAALEFKTGPTMLQLSRQGVDNLAGTSVDGVAKGAYTLEDGKDICLTGSGSEMTLISKAAAELKKKGLSVKVVSFPCWELFEQQPAAYQESVFPAGLPVLSVEMQSTFGWSKYSHAQIGIDRYGESGNGAAVQKHFGFTVEAVVAKAEKMAAHYKGGAPVLRLPQFD